MLDQAFVDLALVRSVTSAILSFKEDSVQMSKMFKDILTYFSLLYILIAVLKIICEIKNNFIYFFLFFCFVSFQSIFYQSKDYTI